MLSQWQVPAPYALSQEPPWQLTPVPSRKRLLRNVVVGLVALQILAMVAWTLLPEKSDPNAYAFLETQLDQVTPVAYDPCQPIHYVVRGQGAPPGGGQLITEAIARVAKATGLTFVYDGPTDQSTADWEASDGVDGERWAPVVISWETPAESPELAGDVAGAAGSTARSYVGASRVYVSGTVTLDAEDMREIVDEPRGKQEARAIIMHELGHLVGLDHVDDKDQLMYPTIQRGTEFGTGDLTGLAALGRGACVPELQAPR